MVVGLVVKLGWGEKRECGGAMNGLHVFFDWVYSSKGQSRLIKEGSGSRGQGGLRGNPMGSKVQVWGGSQP